MTEFTTARPFAHEDVSHWDLETDVAVVGFGASGASAAIEAAAAGARTTIFEMGSGSGGASALSGGEIYVGGGTDVQQAAGFDDSVEALEAYLLAAGGPDADAAKVGLYARESLNHFQWLKDQGVPYKGTFVPGKIIEPETDDTLIWSGSEEAWPFSEQAKPAPRGHVIQHMGWGGGRKLVDILEAKARELGVDVRCDARVLSLVVDRSGAVTGLVVKIDNKPLFVRATRGVVLCTGGFCMNQDMIRRYAPEALRLSDPIGENDNGSGILMGMGVGGDAIHMDQFFTTCPWIMPPSLVKGIMVNQRGQRFINEDCYHGRVSRTMIDQPGDRIYLLADNAIFERPIDLARIEIAAVGETWEEVEQELGMPEGTLAATVNTFNRYAAEGRDPIFHKHPQWLKVLDDGPFVALELNFRDSYFSFFTLGGLSTLPTGEVLDSAGKPVSGLFAAGRATSGLPRWGHGYSSGMSLADCTFFGRQAGRQAAASADALVAAAE
ncbi:Succinate dehydrogenase/fumarate reductase, flavoprotein subunit [Sphingomonas laterariae]|uniref:Succinate dehydrogenase/fumarate reductase, flavoprotein subunit n=1 Tax=Edaphosphingomonas laterariae TaxID=861865 RepID=A0A239BKX9_9SPHN|nr:FAD-dependent oxidoreductase [Sphingomonas laterariae]SNS08526.1 Succinate dehydrogenase/fumarate reductase, flavoprotein subunit [Sphingomonas laterariae]